MNIILTLNQFSYEWNIFSLDVLPFLHRLMATIYKLLFFIFELIYNVYNKKNLILNWKRTDRIEISSQMKKKYIEHDKNHERIHHGNKWHECHVKRNSVKICVYFAFCFRFEFQINWAEKMYIFLKSLTKKVCTIFKLRIRKKFF